MFYGENVAQGSMKTQNTDALFCVILLVFSLHTFSHTNTFSFTIILFSLPNTFIPALLCSSRLLVILLFQFF